MSYPEKIDLHMHSTVSDGSDTPELILENVKKAGIRFFALSDHDAVKGCEIIRSLLKEGDPEFITGAEFSCGDEEGKYHILGYAYDPESPAIRELVEDAHQLRMKKFRRRLAKLKEEFAISFPEEEVETLLQMDNPGKPHLANLMVKYGFAKDRNNAIKEVLNRLSVPSEHIPPEKAIKGILAAGGIPVLAHPFYGSGDELIIGEEMEGRLQKLIAFGLQGVEAYYSGFTAKLTAEMLKYAEKYDLYVTAGSDYHGTNKLIELGDNGHPAPEDFPEGLKRFLDEVRKYPGYTGDHGEKKMILIGYEKCDSCRRAMKWLQQQGIAYAWRSVKEEAPCAAELKEWQVRSGIPWKKFFNTSGQLYRSRQLKEKLPTLSEQEILALLDGEGMLVKRPILIAEDTVLVGFRPEEWTEKLKNRE